MPRNHHPGASTLRNRIRITNKTRLRIHHGNLEVDALLIPDEDEEKHHLTNLVAGVDAEDANVSLLPPFALTTPLLFGGCATRGLLTNRRFQEHHLQAVLSASQRHQTQNRPSRGAGDKAQGVPPTAYIPTPDSTGIVDNYAELYPSDRWKDPSTYLSSSSTVEELCQDGLAGGFTYYMDERDKEWLDKNNEEARGEGTSVQGAVSASATRTSARSAKAKGKEPEASQAFVISEAEFELVMGLFEKVTHEKTEYLHHVCLTIISACPELIYYRGSKLVWRFPPFQNIKRLFRRCYLRQLLHLSLSPLGSPLQLNLFVSLALSTRIGKNGGLNVAGTELYQQSM